MAFVDNLRDWARRQRSPFTVALIASFILVSCLFTFGNPRAMFLLAIRQGQPWGILTYPWAFGFGGGIIFLVFMSIWLFQVGSNLEFEMETPRFALFWFGMTAFFGLALSLGAAASRIEPFGAGPLLPISAVTIAWCVRNRSVVIMLLGFIPLRAEILGWITAALILLAHAGQSPVFGVVVAVPLAFVYFFANDQIPGLAFTSSGVSARRHGRRPGPNQKEATTRGQAMYDQTYFDDVKRREIERLEKERLRKLLGEDE